MNFIDVENRAVRVRRVVISRVASCHRFLTASVCSLSALLILFTASCVAELVTLSIQPSSFPDASSVSVIVDAGFLGDDEVLSSLSGEVTLDLLPSAVNPVTAQITALNAVVDDEIAFRVGGGFLLPTVTVDADAGEVMVHIVDPGEPGQISNGTFSQLANLVGFTGEVRTSIQAEPFDLSAEAPTVADFEDIELSHNRTDLTVNVALVTSISIPIDVEIFSLDVLLDIDGSLSASGIIPAANYALIPSAGTVTEYGAPQNWLRGDVPDTGSLPIGIDSVSIEFDGNVDLGDVTRKAELVKVVGQVDVANGILSTRELNIESGSQLVIESNMQLSEPDESQVRVAGGGHLQLDGIANAEVVLVEGSLSGSGQAESVFVSSSSSLSLSTAETLTVAGMLDFEDGSALRVMSAAEDVGTFTLLIADSVNIDDLASLPMFINDNDFGIDDERTHLGAGRFRTLEISPTHIQLIASQAALGDADGNGIIEFADFLSLSGAFGGGGTWENGDFDGNGLIEFADFLVLSSQFGNGPNLVAVVPEPANGRLLLFGFALYGIRRLRRKAATMPRRGDW